MPDLTVSGEPAVSWYEEPTMLDRIIDNQKERIIRETLTVENAMIALENALDEADSWGNPLVAKVDEFLRGHKKDAAELLNSFALGYLLGDQIDPTENRGDDPQVRFRMRRQIKAQARMDAAEKHPEWSRSEIRNAVNRELTDERIVDAIRAYAVTKNGNMACAGIKDWWQWLKDNWSWSTFFSIVGLLLLFI